MQSLKQMTQVKHSHLIRIVRLTFEPAKVDDFIEMFASIRSEIRAFEGCSHLELLQDASYPNIFTTYSVWIDEPALHAYRRSDLFKKTWQQTKTMFAAPPSAYSYFQRQVLP